MDRLPESCLSRPGGGLWSSGGEEFGKSDEVVGGSFEGEHPSYSIATAVLCLTEGGSGLDPAKWLFDAFTQALADGVTRVPGGAAVDRRAAAAGIASDMRRHAEVAQIGDVGGGIVGLVRPQRDAARRRGGFDRDCQEFRARPGGST